MLNFIFVEVDSSLVRKKEYLNEEHITIIDIDIKYLENYDYIRGSFIEYIKNIR